MSRKKQAQIKRQVGQFLTRKFWDWQQELGERKNQKEFADMIGIHPAQLSNYWNEKRIPTGEPLHILADALGEEIYDLTENERPDPILRYITTNWEKLSSEQQSKLYATFLEMHGKNAPKNKPGVTTDPIRVG